MNKDVRQSRLLQTGTENALKAQNPAEAGFCAVENELITNDRRRRFHRDRRRSHHRCHRHRGNRGEGAPPSGELR